MFSFGVGMDSQDDEDDEPAKIEEPLPWTRDHDHTRKSCRFELHWHHG